MEADSKPIKAVTIRKIFSRETSVSIDIKASTAIIWAMLTNATQYREWNTTILALEGEIALNERIVLKSTLGPSRVFKLKIKDFNPCNRLVWEDAMGKRIFLLSQLDKDVTRFTMSEKLAGLSSLFLPE